MALTMNLPGTLDPSQVAQIAAVPSGPRKRCGLVPMGAGSLHLVKLGAKPEYLTAKDRRLHAHASGAYFCTGCPKPLPKVEGEQVAPYRMFADRAALLAGHSKSPAEMDRDGEIHLFGFWSNDAIGRPVSGCKRCQAATGEARKVDAAAAEVPCADHHGGALGLLSPDDPAGFLT
jgi:hypothetical protein